MPTLMLTVFVISESSETLKNNETKLTFIFVVMSILAYGREGKRDEKKSTKSLEILLEGPLRTFVRNLIFFNGSLYFCLLIVCTKLISSAHQLIVTPFDEVIRCLHYSTDCLTIFNGNC